MAMRAARAAFGGWLLACGLAAATEPAPAFQLPSLDGSAQVSLQAQRGQVVLLDFWASWCAPCRHSLPAYGELQAAYAARGLRVLAVGLDEQVEDGRAYVAASGLTLGWLSDPQGEVAAAYALQGMPTALLIDRRGDIRRRWIGFDAAELPALRRDIEALLAESP